MKPEPRHILSYGAALEQFGSKPDVAERLGIIDKTITELARVLLSKTTEPDVSLAEALEELEGTRDTSAYSPDMKALLALYRRMDVQSKETKIDLHRSSLHRFLMYLLKFRSDMKKISGIQ